MRGLTALAVLAWMSAGAAVGNDRFRLFPNSSIQIRDITEDQQGFLWLAASDGLYRFDGSHYHRLPDFPYSSARSVARMADGSLWIGATEGLLRYVDNKFQEIRKGGVDFVTVSGNHLYLGLAWNLYEISPDGRLSDLKLNLRGPPTVDRDGYLIVTTTTGVFELAPNSAPHRLGALPAKLMGDSIQAARDLSGRVWVADATTTVQLNGPVELHRALPKNPARAFSLASGRNGYVWFLGYPIMEFAKSAHDLNYRKTQPGLHIQTAFDDSRGRLWIAINGMGLLEGRGTNHYWYWAGAAFDGGPAQTAIEEDKNLLIAVHDGGLYRIDGNGILKRLPGIRGDFYCVFPLSDGSILASTKRDLLHLNHQGYPLQRISVPNLQEHNESEVREIVRGRGGTLWLAGKSSLFRLERTGGRFHAAPVPLPQQGRKAAQAVDLELDAQGRLWVGYSEGIAWRDERGIWQKIQTDRAIEAVRSFTVPDAARDEIWVAFRSQGRFARLRREGTVWKVEEFLASEGYGPDSTYFIKRDHSGRIWRGTEDGVFVSDGVHVKPDDWFHFTLNSGLGIGELDQYGFLDLEKARVFVRPGEDPGVLLSGKEGVAILAPQDDLFERTKDPLQITRIQADKIEVLWPADAQGVPAGTHTLRFDIGMRDSALMESSRLSFRLSPLIDEWRPVNGFAVEVNDLPAGNYTLEIAHSGPNMRPELRHRITVSAPGWRFPWRAAGVSVLVLALIGAALRFSPWFSWLHYRASRASRRLGLRTKPHDPPRLDHSGMVVDGRYRLLDLLFTGGFSTVYRAFDRQNNEEVAVKVLGRRTTSESWVKSRFAHEIAALRLADHPGIIRILSHCVTAEGWPCIVMPLVEGVSLRTAINSGSLHPRRAADILERLGDALSIVHRHGVVHRDIKPENILLARLEGVEQPILIDFGNAGWLGANDGMDETQLLTGSIHYMAPEQLTNHYAQSSDTYSLAIVVLEMLTGKRLFDLEQSDPGNLAAEITSLLARSFVFQTDNGLAKLLVQAYSFDPAKRPSEISVWAASIARILRETFPPEESKL